MERLGGVSSEFRKSSRPSNVISRQRTSGTALQQLDHRAHGVVGGGLSYCIGNGPGAAAQVRKPESLCSDASYMP